MFASDHIDFDVLTRIYDFCYEFYNQKFHSEIKRNVLVVNLVWRSLAVDVIFCGFYYIFMLIAGGLVMWILSNYTMAKRRIKNASEWFRVPCFFAILSTSHHNHNACLAHSSFHCNYFAGKLYLPLRFFSSFRCNDENAHFKIKFNLLIKSFP